MNRKLIAALMLLTPAAVPVKAAEESKNPAVKKEPAAGVVSKLVATTYGAANLHRVSSDGKIVPFKLPAGTVWGNGNISAGSNDPVESPDGKLLAYVQKGSLNIRPIEGGKATVVVSGYAHHELLMTGWAPNGESLVYFLGPPQADDAPPSRVKEEKFFVYDLKKKASREIKLGGAFCGWLPDGEMLVHDPEKGTVSSQALTPGSAPKVLLRETKDYGQIAVSPDGRKIAATVNKFGNPGTSQLITVELAGGAVTPLTKESGWADVQWPQWSPSGKQISWQLRVGEKEGMPQSTVVVNGKNLTKPAMTGTHQWLTEKALVVVELEAIVVVDAESGKELGRKPTGAKSK